MNKELELFAWLVQRALDIRKPNVPWTKEETEWSWQIWEEKARHALDKIGGP